MELARPASQVAPLQRCEALAERTFVLLLRLAVVTFTSGLSRHYRPVPLLPIRYLQETDVAMYVPIQNHSEISCHLDVHMAPMHTHMSCR